MLPNHRFRSNLLGGLALLASLALPASAGAADVNPCAARTLNPCAAKTLNACQARTLNACQARQSTLP